MLVRILVLFLALALQVDIVSAKQMDFTSALDYIDTKITELENNPKEFASKLEDIHKQAWEYETVFTNLSFLKPQAAKIINRIFLQRLRLRQIIQKFDKQQKVTPEFIRAVRKIFRTARTAEDMLYELAIDFQQKKLLSPHIPAFSNRARNLNIDFKVNLNQFNPEYGKKFKVKSGDVFIIKGNAFMSAAIARIGDVDSSFSHAAIAYVDPKTKKISMVEAQVANGVRIIPFEQFINQRVGRMIQFRYVPQNESEIDLAKKAAHFAYEYTRLTLEIDRPIIYGFDMGINNYDTQFCSKVIRWAYDRASRGEVKIPTDLYLSKLDLNNNAFIQRIGVEVEKTFAPADLELTPEFDLVTEWRDPRMTQDLRVKDQVLTSMMRWLEEENMQFQSTQFIESLAGVANLEVSQKITEYFIGPVPVEIPQHILATVIMLERTGSKLYKYTKQQANLYLEEYGAPMPPKDLEKAIDLARSNLQKEGRIGYIVPTQ